MRVARLRRADSRWRRVIERRALGVAHEDPADAFVRARGPLRRVLAALAERFVAARGWEPLGFARLGDWARERVGLSARQLQDLARTGALLERLPLTEAALVSGALPWSKVRLVGRVATPADEAAWLARARAVSVRALEHEVRAVDRAALDVTDEDGTPREERAGIRIRCTAEVHAKWSSARQLARRVAGEALPVWEAMEAVAAEVLSAFPLEVDPGIVGAIAPGEPLRVVAAAPAEPSQAAWATVCAAHALADACPTLLPAVLPRFLAPLVDGLDEADAAELDARLRAAVAMEQRLEAALGAHLLGVANVERHAREHLGISPRKARGILRLARAARRFPQLAEAWRSGRLSWAKAQTLLTALETAPERAAEWLALAERATLRRLEDDLDRQLCAQPTSAGEREDCEIFWTGPADAIQLFRATLSTVRRRVERKTGRLPSEGGGLEVMLDHVLIAWGWGGNERRIHKERRVFARDGWRCTVPGCTSYRNLHAHHIRYRSAGGSDHESNLTTLCAKHHLRGVHAGIVRIRGLAPDGLRFALGPLSFGPGELATAPA
jgi:hypothetical protein